MKLKYSSVIAALVLFSPAFVCAKTSLLEGKWYTTKPEKNAVIEIKKCTPDGDTYCGEIVELQTPNYPDGTPKIDKNNKNEKLRTRPILGIHLLTGFKKDGENSWSEGKIYNPEDGDIYSCEITLKKDGETEFLDVRGYVGVPLFGKTQTWMRLKDGEHPKWPVKKEDSSDAEKEQKEKEEFVKEDQEEN